MMLKEKNHETLVSNYQSIESAVRDFSTELVNSAQYKRYEIARENFRKDIEAQNALQEYQSRARDLQLNQMLNNLSPDEQQNLNRLWMDFQSHDSVVEFFTAQEEFQALCRSCAQIISDHCGLDYAASCGASCCG